MEGHFLVLCEVQQVVDQVQEHHRAMLTGLHQLRGAVQVLIDVLETGLVTLHLVQPLVVCNLEIGKFIKSNGHIVQSRCLSHLCQSLLKSTDCLRVVRVQGQQ